MSVEAVTNGKQMLFINRPAAYSGKRKGLGVKQLAWLERTFPGISRNTVQKVKS
jgi:hypothetical protein